MRSKRRARRSAPLLVWWSLASLFWHFVEGKAGPAETGSEESRMSQTLLGQQADPDRLEDPGLDIWVFAGQSNSQGWALLKAPVEPDPRILFFNEQNQWVVAEEPLNKRFYEWTPGPVDENILLQRFEVLLPKGSTPEKFLRRQLVNSTEPLGGVGPALFFAKALLQSIDRRIGLISCGVGSSIKQWNPQLRSQEGSLYGLLLERIARAGGEIHGLIWYQGESDALTAGAAAGYEEAFLGLIDAIRRDTKRPDLPVVYVQIGRFVHPYDAHARAWEKIRDTQYRAAFQRKNLHMVSAIDLPLEDSIHLSFEAYQRLGPRLAEIALTEVYRQDGHGRSIQLDSVEILQASSRRPLIRVRFRGVSGRLTAPGPASGFELRSKLQAEDPSRSYPLPPSPDVPIPVIYRVDFDPGDPAALILGVFDNSPILLGKRHAFSGDLSLIYGAGLNPNVNIVDERDIPIPAFGPVEISLPE